MSDRRQPETFGCEPTALGGGSLHRLDMLRERLAAVEADEQHIDVIAARCGMPVQETNAILLRLQMANLVRQLPGMFYQLK